MKFYLALAVALVLALAALAAYWAFTPTSVLAASGDSSPVGGTAELDAPGRHGTVLSFSLCVEKGDTITIDAVEATGARGGLAITAFTLADPDDIPDFEGWVPTRIPTSYLEQGSKSIDARCGDAPFPALILEVQAPRAVVSEFESVRIEYDDGNSALTIPFSMRICQLPIDALECQKGR